jgi:phage shock protein E
MIKKPAAGAALLLACLAAAAATAEETAAQPAKPAAEIPAENAPPISPSELMERLKSRADVLVLDVRTPAEFAAGHVPGARNVSHDQLATRLEELAAFKDKEVVLYCRSGRRTKLAGQTLQAAGFTRLRHLEGDYPAWEAAQRPIERSAP